MRNCNSSWWADQAERMHPWKLRQAARCFFNGGLLAYPTEAVYGLGCDPLNGAAVEYLLQLKQRPVDKGLILIAAELSQLRPFVQIIADERMAPVLASWPGPATWLLPATRVVPNWLTGTHSSIAVRVTAHPLAAALCRACDSPLVSTSANLAGHPPARSALEVRIGFRGESAIDCILHGEVGPEARPTPIRDAMSGANIRS